MRWICCFMMLTLTMSHAGTIIVTPDFDRIMQEADSLESNSLILFDVDGALIAPHDAILQYPEHKDLFSACIAGHSQGRDLFREIRLKAPHSLVDSKSILHIQALQKRNIPVIAFTAAPAKIRDSEQPGDWRVHELQKYGFDFSAAFPTCVFLELPKNPDQLHTPFFKSGVLFSSFHPKGDILLEFLQRMHVHPNKVIFIDDELEHVQSVVMCLTRHGIACTGIHYTAAHQTLLPVNVDQARFQVNYFIEHGMWISDNECEM
jgi:hypothetical protein